MLCKQQNAALRRGLRAYTVGFSASCSTSSSDASVQAYRAVAYLRTVDPAVQTYLSFLIARSRVSPKRVHSIPRLELCGSLVVAQIAKMLLDELTRPIPSTVLWTDSTMVL